MKPVRGGPRNGDLGFIYPGPALLASVFLVALVAGPASVARAQSFETLGVRPLLAQADALPAPPPMEPPMTQGGTNETGFDGLRYGSTEVGATLGGGLGSAILGGSRTHDLAMARLDYGWMVSDLVGKKWWYRGNWEVVEELFAGWQVRPKSAYVAGETTLLRYNFATGTP